MRVYGEPPLGRFLLACLVGQLIKMAFFAFAGYYSLDWLVNLLS